MLIFFDISNTRSSKPEMDLDQRSRFNLDSMAAIKSRFSYRDFEFLLHCFLSLHVAIRETPIWSWINGPDLILIQRLRLSRDFAYREIGIPVDDIT
jgi:hypothetical protein